VNVNGQVRVPCFDEVADFHGHVCVGLALGYRVAKAAMAALGCERPRDEELVAVVENNSCAVDAIQMVTGCTFGKGNLVFRDYGKHVYTFFDRRSGRGVRLSERYRGLEEGADTRSLTEAVFAGAATPEQQEAFRAHMRAGAEAILSAPEADFLVITEATGESPARAALEPSEDCDECGEPTMRSRLVEVNGRRLCRECRARES
jgi:formylmethanofuran dehydrogenase subunit E